MKDFFKNVKKWSSDKNVLSGLDKVLIVLMILIPIFFSVWFRAYPAYMPVADDWARSNVNSYYKSQITQSVEAQFPNLPEARKTELVNQQYTLFLSTNKDQIETQVKENSQYIRSKFQDAEGYTYLLEIDPFHWMRYVRNYLETGKMYDEVRNGVQMDNHMLFPNGYAFSPILHMWVGVFFYKIANLFGSIPLEHIFFLIPLFIAPLAVIPAFFIARRVGGKVAGFFAGMLVAVHTSFLSRTSAGFTDTDSYNVVLPLFIVWFFLESLYAKNIKSRITFASLAGIFVVLFKMAWSGWWYSYAIIIGTIIALIAYEFILSVKKHKKVVFDDDIKKTLISSGLFLGVSAVLLIIVSGSFAPVIAFITGPLSFLTIKDVGGVKIWPNVFTTVAEMNEASISSIISSMYGNLFFFIALAGIALSLVYKNFEHSDDEKASTKKRRVSLGFLFFSVAWYLLLVFGLYGLNQTVFLILMAVPPVVAFVLNIKFDMEIDARYAILFIIWFIGVMFATTKGIRFTLMLVPAFCVAFGIAIGSTIKILTRYSEKELGVNKTLSVIVLFVLSLFLLNAPLTQAEQVAKSEIPLINDEWYASLSEINEKASDFAVINSWWDYGHWFKAIADRPVTFDGGTQNTPMAHWIGHVLLTDDEQEAVGILRMLDCGGNNAFTNLNKIVNDELDSKQIIDKMVLVESRSDAEKILRENVKEISDDEVKSVLDNTHCDKLPEDYFITSDDMVGKSGVWAHFGAWNFSKATMVNLVKKNNNQKEPSVVALMDRFGINRSAAEDYYYQIIGNDPDRWIADWPGYVSQDTSCGAKSGLLICQNGLAINLTDNEAFFLTQQGRMHPASLGYVDESGKFRLQTYTENTIPYSAALIQEKSGSIHSILMSPELAGSMFTRMYFFKDESLNHFNMFSKRTQITGGDIIVWKVSWNGKDADTAAEESKMINSTSTSTMSASGNLKAIIDTSMGEIELELYKSEAPKTVENFVNLSMKGFYDGVLFHRVIDGFMIQSGDPLTKGSDTSVYGTGGPGYTIKDESNKYTFDKTGVLAMANTGRPNTGGSQFFITVGQAQWLNGKHTIFGRVTKGYDVVQRISKVKVDSNDMPAEKVMINKVTIVNP